MTSTDSPGPGEGRCAGTVMRVDATEVVVERPGGALERAFWRALDPAPVTGDCVRLSRRPDGPADVTEVLPRRTELTRRDARGTSRPQVLAANVDVVAVVAGLVPEPRANRIERMLALAWASGAQPVVLLTKADLVPDAAEVAAEVAVSSACPVVTVSTVTGEGLDDVRALLAGGRVMALLGPSGVGKSSLLNALTGERTMAVRELQASGKGRHTTVTRELHRVAGGAVLDIPGLRTVGVVDLAGVEDTYADITALALDCRFADCGHQEEPGCAVLAAIDDGFLPERRLDSWRHLRAEASRRKSRRIR